MRAQDLLDMLLKLQSEGVELSSLEVVVGYTEYDSSVPYDCGVPAYRYPSGLEVVPKSRELLIQ